MYEGVAARRGVDEGASRIIDEMRPHAVAAGPPPPPPLPPDTRHPIRKFMNKSDTLTWIWQRTAKPLARLMRGEKGEEPVEENG